MNQSSANQKNSLLKPRHKSLRNFTDRSLCVKPFRQDADYRRLTKFSKHFCLAKPTATNNRLVSSNVLIKSASSDAIPQNGSSPRKRMTSENGKQHIATRGRGDVVGMTSTARSLAVQLAA